MPQALPLVGLQVILVPHLDLAVVTPLVNPQAGHLVLHSPDFRPNHHGEMIHLTRRQCRAL